GPMWSSVARLDLTAALAGGLAGGLSSGLAAGLAAGLAGGLARGLASRLVAALAALAVLLGVIAAGVLAIPLAVAAALHGLPGSLDGGLCGMGETLAAGLDRIGGVLLGRAEGVAPEAARRLAHPAVLAPGVGGGHAGDQAGAHRRKRNAERVPLVGVRGGVGDVLRGMIGRAAGAPGDGGHAVASAIAHAASRAGDAVYRFTGQVGRLSRDVAGPAGDLLAHMADAA